MPVQDHKSLHKAFVIWTALVNTQTHREILTRYIRLAKPAELTIVVICRKGNNRVKNTIHIIHKIWDLKN